MRIHLFTNNLFWYCPLQISVHLCGLLGCYVGIHAGLIDFASKHGLSLFRIQLELMLCTNEHI